MRNKMEAKSKSPRMRSYGFAFAAILAILTSVALGAERHLVRVSHDPYIDPLAHHAKETRSSRLSRSVASKASAPTISVGRLRKIVAGVGSMAFSAERRGWPEEYGPQLVLRRLRMTENMEHISSR
jgi:hypothetical protein